PISMSHTATTLRTMGKNLYSGSRGRISLIHREQDKIVLDRQTISDSLRAEYPLMSPWYIPRVIDSGRILDIYPDDSSTRSMAKHSRVALDVGHGFPHTAEDAVNNAANELLVSAFVCDGHKVYGLFGYYQLLDSLILPEGSNCLLDGNTSSGWTLMWNSGKGKYAIRAGHDQRLTDNVLESELAADTLTWLVSTYHGWIAFDQKHGTFYRGKRTMRLSDRSISETIDSIPMPELASSNATFYQPGNALSADLISFAIDHTVYLAEATDTTFKILSKVVIPGQPVKSTALGQDPFDPKSPYARLWVSTGENLFSFNVKGLNLDSLKTASTASRTLAASNLDVSSRAGTAILSWAGSNPVQARISGLDGRMSQTLSLRPGGTATWRAPAPGLYVASAPGTTKVFLVK
ncbi:MAG TPA: hypothetical protein PKY05_10185, partial [Fibrobacteria bacterium]|nr:hypothetical protein [Fibrobacteria bacterium]